MSIVHILFYDLNTFFWERGTGPQISPHPEGVLDTRKFKNPVQVDLSSLETQILYHNPFKDEAQTALIKDPVRTPL